MMYEQSCVAKFLLRKYEFLQIHRVCMYFPLTFSVYFLRTVTLCLWKLKEKIFITFHRQKISFGNFETVGSSYPSFLRHDGRQCIKGTLAFLSQQNFHKSFEELRMKSKYLPNLVIKIKWSNFWGSIFLLYFNSYVKLVHFYHPNFLILVLN